MEEPKKRGPYKKKGDIDPDTGTVIQNSEPTPKKKTASRSKGLTIDEVKSKLDLIFRPLAGFAGKEYHYSADDYQQEAAGIVRLAQKFEFIESIIGLFDPVVVVAGLVMKFIDMKDRPEKAKAKAEKAAKQPEASGVMPMYKDPDQFQRGVQ